MSVVRWTIYDPITLSTVTFPLNPAGGGTPSLEKTLNYQATAGAGGKTLVFEGRDAPQTIEVSGVILDEAQFAFFGDLFARRHQVQLTDDLGRQYWIYITKVERTRRRMASRPWLHDYTVSALVVDWP